MTREPEGFEVGFNEAMGDWYVMHRQWKGDVLHRNILAERYESEEEASNAAAAMQASLRRFLELPDQVPLLPGHGPQTTVGRERASNPFLVGLT